MQQKAGAGEKVGAIIAESAQEMRALLEETIAGEEPYSPKDAGAPDSEHRRYDVA